MIPFLLNRFLTVSVGCAPLDIQSIAFFSVDFYVSRLNGGIIVTDGFDESAVTRRTRVCYNDTIERSFLAPIRFKRIFYCHVDFHLLKLISQTTWNFLNLFLRPKGILKPPLEANLAIPCIRFIIFLLSSKFFKSLLTSCTRIPQPWAIRLRYAINDVRVTSFFLRSWNG